MDDGGIKEKTVSNAGDEFWNRGKIKGTREYSSSPTSPSSYPLHIHLWSPRIYVLSMMTTSTLGSFWVLILTLHWRTSYVSNRVQCVRELEAGRAESVLTLISWGTTGAGPPLVEPGGAQRPSPTMEKERDSCLGNFKPILWCPLLSPLEGN